MLIVQDVSKNFGEKRALNQVSLQVPAGCIFGFIGPNGSGKTTLIRSIIGALRPDSGDIRVAGKSVLTDALYCKQRIAYVPDNPDVYDFLTGLQYLTYIADIFRVPLDLRQRRIAEYSQLFGLTDALPDLVSSYSHGMRQKLVLIGAFLHEPELLVLDEPFVGLDPEATYRTKELLRDIAQRGSAVFFSSHVLEVVEKLCDEIAIVQSGTIRAAGPTDSIVGDESLEEVFLDLIETEHAKAPSQTTSLEGEPEGKVRP